MYLKIHLYTVHPSLSRGTLFLKCLKPKSKICMLNNGTFISNLFILSVNTNNQK